MHNKFDMKGGRKLRAPGPSTVHKALKNMT